MNYVTPVPEFAANAQRMLREMIRQHHNHPSVVTWGTMNEIFLWSREGARVQRIADSTYGRQVRDFAVAMQKTAREEDPARPVAMAIHGSDDYERFGISDAADLLGPNIYSGWYSGRLEEFGTSIDRRHARRPRQPLLISEYGSGSELRVNAEEPERFDHSGTYHRLYHESYLRQPLARPWLTGMAVWNQFDFSQPHIGESTPHINKKGLLTFDRRTKDVYYMYQANWTTKPMVYVASRDWARRAGVSPAGDSAVTQPVDVYTNLALAELFAEQARPGDGARRGSVLLSGFDLVDRAGLDPVADRLLANLVRYTASAAPHEAHPLVASRITWGDYASERGLVTGIYNGLLLHTVPVVPAGLAAARNVRVDSTGFVFAGAFGGWNTNPSIQYVGRGRRPYGPFAFTLGGAVRLERGTPKAGEARFWLRVPAGRRTMVTTVENVDAAPHELEVELNGARTRTAVPAGATVRIETALQGASDLAVAYRGDRRLVILETDFR